MNPKITKMIPFGVMLEPGSQAQAISDVSLELLRKLFREENLIVLRGFKTFHTSDEFSIYCERFGEISIWPFGKVLELVEQENPQDHIFDHRYVPLHWDGMYRPEVPEYQIFHCVSAPLGGQGGRTTFSNTMLALKHSSLELKNAWEQVTGIYRRKMEFYNSETVSAIVTQHPYLHYPVIRYNELAPRALSEFVNPPDTAFLGITPDEQGQFHETLRKKLYDPLNFYAHEWQTGDVVIADNFSLLHGREGFVSKTPRHLRRVHVLSDPPFTNPGLRSYEGKLQ